MDKIKAFEYLILKLVEWYGDNNDMGTLKSLKLLWFVSVVEANKDSKDSLIDKVFDNFHAMPYGHVEKDIYEAIRGKKIKNIELKSNTANILNKDRILETDKEIRELIDKSIEKFKILAPEYINLLSFDLVILSQRWYSWKYYYKKARQKDKFSEKIPNEIIKNEFKYYETYNENVIYRLLCGRTIP